MKKNYLITVLSLVLLVSCETEPNKKYSVSFLYDITDENSNFSTDDAKKHLIKVFEYLDLNENSLDVNFNFCSDISSSVSVSEKINGVTPGIMSRDKNPIVRNKYIAKRREEINTKLESFLNQTQVGRTKTYLYANICNLLKKLSKKEYDKNYIIIYSDLLENSDYLKLDNAIVANDVKKFINNNNDDYIAQLESVSTKEVPFVENTSLYFITKNRNTSNDARIVNAEKFWTTLLKNKNYAEGNFFFDSDLDLDVID